MKVLILCGGQGTRLKEETEYRPKPMVEVGNKPILWHIMKIYSYYGFNEFILALGYKGNIIRDYFLNYDYYHSDFKIRLGNNSDIKVYRNHDEHQWEVTLVETGMDSMTGYRVKLCEKYIDTKRFMLTYGDAVSNINIKKLLKFHKEQGTIGTVTGVYPPSRFGDLDVSGEKVTKFKEKGVDWSKQQPINGGFFVFEKEFLKNLPEDPSCDLEGLPLERLASSGQLSVYKHTGFWQCMDTYRDNIYLNELWSEGKNYWRAW